MLPMTLAIEDASIRHLEKLYEIEKQCFETEAFTKSQIANLLTDYNSIGLIAKADGEIVGFIIGTLYFERSSAVGHVLTIDVSPSHRRKEIGLRLIQEIVGIFRQRGAKTSSLEVREDNIAALRLYEKCGYKKVGKLKNYYGTVHGIYLRKTLV
jgi:ribosomal-protein-alanine acetyltransferase